MGSRCPRIRPSQDLGRDRLPNILAPFTGASARCRPRIACSDRVRPSWTLTPSPRRTSRAARGSACFSGVPTGGKSASKKNRRSAERIYCPMLDSAEFRAGNMAFAAIAQITSAPTSTILCMWDGTPTAISSFPLAHGNVADSRPRHHARLAARTRSDRLSRQRRSGHWRSSSRPAASRLAVQSSERAGKTQPSAADFAKALQVFVPLRAARVLYASARTLRDSVEKHQITQENR